MQTNNAYTNIHANINKGNTVVIHANIDKGITVGIFLPLDKDNLQ